MTVYTPSQWPPHGGNLTEATERFGAPAQGWLDLSTGINPHPYPLPTLRETLWTALPQSDLEFDLQQTAAATYGASDADTVVCAPGTQILIQLLPWVLGTDRMVAVAPTYGEYAPAWRNSGATVIEVPDLEPALTNLESASRPTLVLCNPNNPDGRTWTHQILLDIADHLTAKGGTLVVDEAFADVVPQVSLAPKTDRPGLVVLRSFGKFFGLAGLRLGFALASPQIADALRRLLGPWAVSGPALDIGCRALKDSDWIDVTRRQLSADAKRLDDLLCSAGFEMVGGTPLYRLTAHPEAQAWQEALAKQGIWVRAFEHQPDRLRFGLPGKASDWQRLSSALQKPSGNSCY